MSARLGPGKINGEHQYFFALADLKALILWTDAVVFLGDDFYTVSFTT